MALRQILEYPHPLLKKRAAPVATIGGEVATLIEDLAETMYAAPGVGLAATQVGVGQRVIVLDIRGEDEAPGKRLLKLINPEIAEREGEVVWEEGCLSVPDLTAPVKRARRVLVRAWTPEEREVGVSAPEVKRFAEANRLPVLQPERLRDAAFQDALRALAPDLVVVAAYGKILPRAVLDLPPRGCINVHASLLPRHRGAAPIAWSILAGDTVTGVTIMAMNQEMDAGDILLQRETPIAPDATGVTLGERLAPLGAAAIGEAIDGLQAGPPRPVPPPPAGRPPPPPRRGGTPPPA